MSEPHDIELYKRLVQQDKMALETLYNRYEKLIYSFSYRMTKDPKLAEEVVQEVFMKLWKTHAVYSEEKGKFSSWLLTMTRNMALDLIRKQSKRPTVEYEERDSLQEASETPEVMLEEKEQTRLVRRAVTKLKKDQQHIIELFYFQGLTHEKIADRTGLPLGTVKGRIRLALKHLKTHIHEEGGNVSG
ncbi:sigma-70 family RNA polymerase sigma factor [Jeotgalibacillus sp. S-D1]|uniref:RNA polymerase sigma factor n=1 Tax=Jeotgalibacillus sp. S-D1 TaxID=2552189 RepID=UPI001059EABA|nr:sigma-70 family RNA polymerase sigma factor [Jeotgalibacillus sp. S-D1]TDL30687.1 sigma-70 family RNA polymerase sigma factor [Jeotgalibacillus sp. S-D1]